MDFIKWKSAIRNVIGKYKYACIILLIGAAMMLIPTRETEDRKDISEKESVIVEGESLSEELENILSNVSGAGMVKVMLTVSQGERTIFQTDSVYSQGSNGTDTKTETVLITDNEKNETGLIHQKNPPVYQGAIILAQGADIPEVKLLIVDAVSNVTGLGADKISVLEMQ